MGKQKSYAERLQEQMKDSAEFSRRNFGLKVGDGFPELVQEIAGDSRTSGYLMATLAISLIMVPKLGDGIDKSAGNPFTKAILDNLGCFEGTLSMLYWGIQIGRQLEREEVEALKRLSDG